ncbi:MAG: DUF2892 domain-containing protein [Planctomycetaceae bacterium]|nr:MAG: DUF2892 domain-containing protein [Planctomycetaceae bacterium]
MADAEGIVPATEERVEVNTEEEINRRIRKELEACVYYYAQWPEEIDNRLDELDREWDIERMLETSAGIFSVAGVAFGSMHRRWFILPALAGAFLLQHAIQGWCPPLSVLRRMGVRTTREINHERYALKALRGDFGNVRMGGEQSPQERARGAIEAADLCL